MKKYNTVFEHHIRNVRAPDYFVYLKTSVPVLMDRIRKRDRAQEKTIGEDYIKALNTQYDSFAGRARSVMLGTDVLTVETDRLDAQEVAKEVEKRLSLGHPKWN